METLIDNPVYTPTKQFTFLDTREVGKRQYQLLSDFTYTDEVFGVITAKRGFVTNYASLDSLKNIALFPFYAMLAGYGDKSATIHDWLYGGNPIYLANGEAYFPTREECDAIFLRALRTEGVARWRAYVFYIGVRVGGESYYVSQTLKD